MYSLCTLPTGELAMGGECDSYDKPQCRGDYFALWSEHNIPRIAHDPRDTSAAPGSTLVLKSAPMQGFAEQPEGISFEWRRNGIALADGPGGASPGGGIVAGAAGHLTASQPIKLTISGIQPSDAGEYVLVVSNVCGSDSSFAATVEVQGASLCAGDVDGSGAVDLRDVVHVLASFDEFGMPGLAIVFAQFGTTCP